MNQDQPPGPSFGIHKKPMVPKWLWITFIIVAVIGAGFFAYWYLYGPGKKVKTTTTTTNPMAGWLTLTSKDNKYTIKYPSNLTATDTTDNSGGVIFTKTGTTDKVGDIEISALSKDGTPDSIKNTLQSSYTIQSDTTKSLSSNSVRILVVDETSSAYKAVREHIYVGNATKGYYEITGDLSNKQTLENIVSTFEFITTTVSSTPTQTTAAPITYSNGQYGFTMTLPATWAKYKIKTATYDGEVATLYVEMPTTDSAPASTTNDEGYYSPFAITVYTPSQWAAAQAAGGGDIGTLITQAAQYVFVWSSANGVPPSDWNLGNDIKGIIASFKAS